MTDIQLSAYKGPLTPEQVVNGINSAGQNALRLLEDSLLLYKNGSYPTAASLATLAIEEIGKVPILRRLALAKSPGEIKKCWRDYRSHIQKNIAWIYPRLLPKGATCIDDLKPVFDPNSDHPHMLNQLKQAGFYTDCFSNCQWSVPVEEVDELLAKAVIDIAMALVRHREVTKKEIHLWIKYMGPVWNKPPEDIEQGLISWYRAMCYEGLIIGSDDHMEKFIHSQTGY